MDRSAVRKKLDKSLDDFNNEVAIVLQNSSFSGHQDEELNELMRQVFYVLNDFKKVIEELTD